MDKIVIYFLRTALIKDNYSFIFSFVDEKRKEKAEKYVKENDRLLSLGAGYLLKKYLPNEEIIINENGKPYIPNGPFFNISHSGDYVVLAIHQNREVGIDIEKIDNNQLDAIRFVLNKEEEKIADPTTLFQIWSNKESLTKCMSVGLKDIKNISGLPLEGIRTIDEIDYYSKSMAYKGYSLSITLKGKEPFIEEIKHIDILEEE